MDQRKETREQGNFVPGLEDLEPRVLLNAALPPAAGELRSRGVDPLAAVVQHRRDGAKSGDFYSGSVLDFALGAVRRRMVGFRGFSAVSDDYGSTRARAATIALDASGAGSIAGRVNYAGDVDAFTFVARSTGAVTLSLVARDRSLDPVLAVYDSRGYRLAENDDANGTLDSQITMNVVGGRRYYLGVRGYGRSLGAYTASVAMGGSPTPEPGPTPTPDLGPTPDPTPSPTVPSWLPSETAYSAGDGVSGRIIQTAQGSVLVVTGTAAADTITLSQSGNTLSLTAGSSAAQEFSNAGSASFAGIAIYGFGGADIIRQTWSVAGATCVLYAGADADTIYESAQASAYVFAGDGNDLLVSVGGGVDVLTGGGGSDSFWADAADIRTDVESAETAARSVHVISSFARSVSPEINGQNIADPAASYSYVSFASRPLFADGPQYNDILQGNLGDCYFLAALAGIAQSDPGLVLQAVTALGDGTYAVRLYSGSSERYYRLDAQLPASGGLPAFAGLTRNGGELWVALIEKAFAQFRSGSNSYASIEGGWMDEGYAALLGASTTSIQSASLSANALAQRMANELAAGRAVTAGSLYNSRPIIGQHAYQVHSVSQSGSTWNVTVYNPWGVDGNTWDANSDDGLLILTAAQFRSKFTTVQICSA